MYMHYCHCIFVIIGLPVCFHLAKIRQEDQKHFFYFVWPNSALWQKFTIHFLLRSCLSAISVASFTVADNAGIIII